MPSELPSTSCGDAQPGNQGVWGESELQVLSELVTHNMVRCPTLLCIFCTNASKIGHLKGCGHASTMLVLSCARGELVPVKDSTLSLPNEFV